MKSENEKRRPGGARSGAMPFERYPAAPTIPLVDRQWPDRVLEKAPRWCSVDLRDGNQALIEPMGWERKIRLFEQLVAIGFCEIELGFPSASETEFDFVRRLIEENRIPPHVTIQVLTQCRAELIDRTFEAIEGAPQALVHFYNSTSPTQRRVVFGLDRAGILDIATSAAKRVREAAERMQETQVRFQYSPESYSATELDFAVEICDAVARVIEPTPESPLILNLPATVEVSTPNVYADSVEAFGRRVENREAVLLSVHPHNDRGCGVAAAELGLLAGADRVEGTLFGNGERTGNVDLITLALNLMSQGIDPELDLRDLPALVRSVEEANRIPVHPRHPYAGELVYTAFSGSHQDAIRKGLAAMKAEGASQWDVPYLPIDPVDVGRSYDAVIRINSQSGKGGVAYLLETDHGYTLPRRMQIEFSHLVQAATDGAQIEMTSVEIGRLFAQTYLERERAPRLCGERRLDTRDGGAREHLSVEIEWGGARWSLEGEGAGPIDALVASLREAFGWGLRIGDYHEHTLGTGADAEAVAYVEILTASGEARYGAGQAASIVEASFVAVFSALDRAIQDGVLPTLPVVSGSGAEGEGPAEIGA